ncbi:glutaminyl-peptide cyclotransferase [Winslowiella iniecta]|uniref:glutaminyl-peptide cyclotransferase n=1 Tax=Winslowiella iniecta TaxID=1560201 RepID=UPI0009E1B75C|nr:glutaminyl-peptide cyclotransferase [Winslowiella iniecta]
MKDVIIVVSRNDYTSLLKDGELIGSLKGKNIIYIFSVKCSVIPHNTHFEELHLIDIVNSEDYLTALLKSISCRYNITDIVSTGEEDLSPAAYARQALHLNGLQVEQSKLYRNKILMKQRLTSTTIRLPQYSPASEINTLTDMLATFGKIIIKPKDGYSSKGITIVSTAPELNQFLSEQSDFLGQFIAEEFIDSEMYHLDAVVSGGEILFSTLGRYHQPLVNFSSSQWLVSSVTNQASALHEKAKQVLREVLNHFETDKGVFHFEFFSDGDNVIFCEIAMRPAGGGISEAIYETWGIHLHEINVQLQLNIPVTLPVVEDRHSSIILMMSQQQGVITNLLNEDFLEENAYKVLKRKSIGDKVSPAQFSSDSILNVVAVSDNAQDLEDSVRKITSKTYYQIEAAIKDVNIDNVPQKESFTIVRVIPHDKSSFTQGLIIDGEHIIESTGLYKKSRINILEASSGKLVRSKDLPEDLWGEGLTKVDGKYYALTFKEQKVMVLDPTNLNTLNTFSYEGEGWGLTTDGKNLVMSDGSDEITFRDPVDFSVIKTIHVTFNGKKIAKINELQWIKGLIYANVWYTDIILVINPEDGKVVKWIDMAGIQFNLDHFDKNTNTLNGIAYDDVNDKLYVTGKNWSNIFEVKFTTDT